MSLNEFTKRFFWITIYFYAFLGVFYTIQSYL